MVRGPLHFKSLYTVIEQLFKEDSIFLTLVNLLKAGMAAQYVQCLAMPCSPLSIFMCMQSNLIFV